MPTPKKSQNLVQQVSNMNATLARAGIDLKLDANRFVSAADSLKVFRVSFTNPMGVKVTFTVEAAKKELAEDHLAGLPVQLTGKTYEVEEVDMPMLLHFTYAELLQLHMLTSQGVHWYLGQPDEYKEARKHYTAIDPLGRYRRLYAQAEAQACQDLESRMR